MHTDQIEDIYTLSPLQQGMLFHIVSAPSSRLYLDQTICTIEGHLEVEAFRRAWEVILGRHPALRTTFLWEGLSKPVQVVHRKAPLRFDSSDWRNLSPKVQKAQLEAFLRQDRQEDFDLTQPPLMRLHLIRTGDREYQLLWTVYHLVVDAWCSSIILKEVVEQYEACRAGERLERGQVYPYREYISWLKRQNHASAQKFWQWYLEGFREPNRLGTDEPGSCWPGMPTGHRHEFAELTPDETEALRELARRHHLTLNTLVHGAWSMVLAHHCGNDDVVFGSAVSGRPPELPGVETTVGLFINTLPHRCRLDRNASLISWLETLQRRQLEMRQYESTPLSKIQSWSEIADGLPLFESILVFLNVVDLHRQDTGSLKVRDLRYIGRPHYPLTLNVTPGPHLAIEIVYDVQRLRWAEVRRFLDHLTGLLRTVIAKPGQTVGDFVAPLQSEDRERRDQARKRRRDSNTDKLRITRPIAVKLVAN